MEHYYLALYALLSFDFLLFYKFLHLLLLSFLKFLIFFFIFYFSTYSIKTRMYLATKQQENYPPLSLFDPLNSNLLSLKFKSILT